MIELDNFLKELPAEIIGKSVAVLKEVTKEYSDQLRNEAGLNPETWWTGYHHGWGTSIRNLLRDRVCRDQELPSQNWDDYYIQLVEIACGIREYK